MGAAPSMHTDPDTTTSSELDAALAASFPASDPPAATSPMAVTAAVGQVPIADVPKGGDEILRLYRIIEARQASEPFSGPGSDGGGRWTSPGTAGVYASLSPSTAMLEYMVHLEGVTPEDLLLVTASVPHDCVLAQLQLPGEWRARPYRPSVRQVGDAWSGDQRSLALRVPSAVCPDECNVIINPRHRDFVKLQVETLTPITLDARLRI